MKDVDRDTSIHGGDEGVLGCGHYPLINRPSESGYIGIIKHLHNLLFYTSRDLEQSAHICTVEITSGSLA